MSSGVPKHNISWPEMQAHIWDGCDWVQSIAKDREIKVAAVANGAMIFGFYAAKLVGVKLYSIPVGSYEQRSDGTAHQVKEPVVDEDDLPSNLIKNGGEDVVVLEDILDTTRTIRAVKVPLPLAKYGVLYSKPTPGEATKHVDFCAEYIPQVDVRDDENPYKTKTVDPWVEFPYDKDILERYPGANI